MSTGLKCYVIKCTCISTIWERAEKHGKSWFALEREVRLEVVDDEKARVEKK